MNARRNCVWFLALLLAVPMLARCRVRPRPIRGGQGGQGEATGTDVSR